MSAIMRARNVSWRAFLRRFAAMWSAVALAMLIAAPVHARARCRSTCTDELRDCRARCATLRGTDRRACRERCTEVSTCTAPGARIRTLAYVVGQCRSDAAGLSIHQVLQIRRGDCDPVPVREIPFSEPVPDIIDACRRLGETRVGGVSVVGGAFQRLAVGPDGTNIVFEVTDDFSFVLPARLAAEDKGFFLVRSDGTGLRRLGEASRDPSFRLKPDPSQAGGFAFSGAGKLVFSPNGKIVAFTDLGPGPAGEAAIQIVTMDVVTGDRTMITHLPSGTPVDPQPVTGYPSFVDDETISFDSFANPDGLNPRGEFLL